MKKLFLLNLVFLFAGSTAYSQWIDYYGFARVGGSFVLRNDLNSHLDYYNEVNNASTPKPRLTYGYKFGGGVTLQKFVFGMSQQVQFQSTSGEKGDLPDGYRVYDMRYRVRSGIMGYYSPKRNMINLELGIAHNYIRTGFKYNDGFVSYGPDKRMNGSYLGYSFVWGLEYVWNKEITENLFFSATGGLQFSHAINRYEDRMDYKRTISSTNYVLLKDEDPNFDLFPNPSHLSPNYTMASFNFGVFYKISFK
jgi:hypothetical protein